MDVYAYAPPEHFVAIVSPSAGGVAQYIHSRIVLWWRYMAQALQPNLHYKFLSTDFVLTQKLECFLHSSERVGVVKDSSAVGLDADFDELRNGDWHEGLCQVFVLRKQYSFVSHWHFPQPLESELACA